jgi:hypothetical protein
MPNTPTRKAILPCPPALIYERTDIQTLVFFFIFGNNIHHRPSRNALGHRKPGEEVQPEYHNSHPYLSSVHAGEHEAANVNACLLALSL